MIPYGVQIRATQAIHQELAIRGDVESGLITIVLAHVRQLRKLGSTELLTEHQQEGELMPFAVSISSHVYPKSVLVTTYQEAVESGLFDTDGEILQ